MPCRYHPCPMAGTYYALRRTEPPQLIFAEPRDYEEFDDFLAQTLERTDTKLLGYCWMPDSVHLALRIDVTPLAEVMGRITRYCSRHVRSRTGASVRYLNSFPMILPDPDIHLPMLLRYIHCLPVIAGAAASPSEYPYTSHRAYAGELHRPLASATALQRLASALRLH